MSAVRIGVHAEYLLHTHARVDAMGDFRALSGQQVMVMLMVMVMVVVVVMVMVVVV